MTKTIHVSFPKGKIVSAHINNFTVLTDQSFNNGGDESHPEPIELFLSSIATCAGIYALEFCKKRELELTGLSLLLNAEWDKESKLFTPILITLTLPINFPSKYRSAIIKVIELCTVKRHLDSSIDIRTSLQDYMA